MIRTRPFLKWAGNKFRCLDNILGSFPSANRLIEPFAGSAAVFINSNFPDNILAEENIDLINLFKFVQQEGDAFIDHCQLFFSPKNNSEKQYYLLREQFNQCNNPRERAALFLYLNRHGYNGLCRYNRLGGYNVPFGRYSKPYFPRHEMRYFHKKSQHAQFIKADFRVTFAKAKPGDLIYCDPPYAPREQSTNFTNYVNKAFGEEEQIILAELAMEYAARGITVIISNHDTPFTRHHYRYGEIKSFTVPRSINCNGENRIPVHELIAIFAN